MVTYILSGPGRTTCLVGVARIRTNTYKYGEIRYDYVTITLRLRHDTDTLRYDTLGGTIQYNTIRYDTIWFDYVQIRRKKGKRYLLASEKSRYICDEMSRKQGPQANKNDFTREKVTKCHRGTPTLTIRNIF